jgi:hypothetical protein
MLDNVDGFLQTIENKAMGVKPLFSEAEKHSRSLVKDNVIALEDSAGAARLVVVINNGHTQASFGKQAGSSQAG